MLLKNLNKASKLMYGCVMEFYIYITDSGNLVSVFCSLLACLSNIVTLFPIHYIESCKL